jgi:hypothetical protein
MKISAVLRLPAVLAFAPGSPAFDAMAGAGRIISSLAFTDRVPHILVSLWEG